MDFFHSWAAFLPKFLDKSYYDKKETKKYKFGIVNSFYKWKSSQFREKRLCLSSLLLRLSDVGGSSVDQEPTVDSLPSALPSGIPNKKWHYESSWPILFSSKLIWKETLFPPKFDSRMVNADWLITRQVKQTLDYVNYGAVDGLLNECIRRYFYSPRAKEAEEVTSLVNIPIRSINRV